MAPLSRKAPALRWRWLLPVAVVLLGFHFSPFGATLDRAFFDAASRHPLRPPPLPANSALILVDETTMTALGARGVRWPFPRIIFAQLIAALSQAGAARVLVDFTFFEESSADQDQLLATVAAAAPAVVLARTKGRAPVFWSEEFRAAHPAFFRQPRTGLVEFPADEDGIARSYIVPGSLAAAAFEPPARVLGGLLRWHGGTRQLREQGVPVLSALPFINAGQPIIERLIAAAPDLDPEQIARALAAEAAITGDTAALVRGRVVVVGTNASGTFDFKPTSVGRVEPGALLHWTAWSNLAAGGFVTAVPRLAILFGGLLFAAPIAWAGRRRSSLVPPVLMALGLAILLLAGSYVALAAGYFVPPATALAAVALTLLGVVAESYWSEQARKREIQAMFGSYVDPAVVALLVRDPTAIQLGGERREATVFFCDLAGFTDLSEQVSPEELLELINGYLQETSDCLMAHGAYIDKYIGDAVMAVFGAPLGQVDHALAACRAALEAQRVLAARNIQLARTHGRTLGMRIGINTGQMIVGNLGSERKRNYTVLGDAVNLASRLEGANKEFGTSILLGETTAALVRNDLVLRPLTALRVKGKLTAVQVCELVGEPDDITPAKRAFLTAYDEGHALYSARRFAEAAAALERAATLAPDDEMTQNLLAEARQFAVEPPPPDWQPILSLKTK